MASELVRDNFFFLFLFFFEKKNCRLEFMYNLGEERVFTNMDDRGKKRRKKGKSSREGGRILCMLT